MSEQKQIKIDAQFFIPFIDGTKEAIKVQCFTDVTTKKPFYKGSQPQEPFDLAGVISIQSPTFAGTITILFSDKLFLHLMGKWLGETFTEVTEDLQSGAGELLNIIFGSAKVELNKKGYAIQKAIPTVVRGQALTTTHPKTHPVLVLPFEAAGFEFYMEIFSEDGFRL